MARGRGWRAGAVALVAAAGLVTTAPAAAAHTRLDLADPGAGAVLEDAPAVVDLVFEDPVEAQGARVSVTDPAGRELVTDVRASGPVVSADLTAGAAGTQHLAFHVTGQDGHAVEGAWTFEVGVPGAGADAGPSPSPLPPPAPPSDPVPAASPEAVPEAGARLGEPPALPWAVVAPAAVVVSLGGLLVGAADRPRRSTSRPRRSTSRPRSRS